MSKLLMVDVSGRSLSADEKAMFAEHKPAGICLFSRNIQDKYQMAEFSEELREHCGENLIIAVDQEGGSVVRALDLPFSPGNMLLGAANDLELTRQVAAATARGLKAIGINMNFAPVADVNNNSLNPVIGDRSFGEDPKKVAAHVVAYLQGLQSEGVAATVKHFPGHGDTSVDSHHDLPVLAHNMERLRQIELYPFKKAIAAGVSAVMSYHGILSAIDAKNPSTLSRNVMTDLLRDELGFDGLSVTDALEMKAIAKTYKPTEAVVAALKAGIDMPLYDVHQASIKTHIDIFEGIAKSIENGELDSLELKQSQNRIERLAKCYSLKAEPDAAWQEGDKELLDSIARKAVVAIGKIPKFENIVLVYAKNVVGGSASDNMKTPAEQLSRALHRVGFKLKEATYNRQNIDKSLQNELKSKNIVFVSASRTRMTENEKRFARAIAKNSSKFLHIALWNPYHVEDLPQPALISFGFREWSINAIVDSLKTAETTGRLPISLKPWEALG